MKNLFIFKTDVATAEQVNVIEPVLNGHPIVEHWFIDTEDIDNVLKVETKAELREGDVVTLLKKHGFQCQGLPD